MTIKPASPLWAKWSDATAEATHFDEERSRRRWVEAFSSRSSVDARSKRPPLSPILAAAAVLLLLVGGAGWWLGHSGTNVDVVPGAWLETRAAEQFPMHFAEGSEVVVHGDSRVHVESVDPRGARMIVERGGVSANIVHRGDTRWAFVAGPFRVRVTGTELAVRWDPKTEEFSVSVSEGSVEVTGPLIEDGREVGAGERCSVAVRDERLEVSRAGSVDLTSDAADAKTKVVDVEALPLEEELDQADPESIDSPSVPGAVERKVPDWQRFEQEGRYKEAIRAARHVGLERLLQSGSASELMSLSRAARFAGHHELAGRSLQQIRDRFAGSRQAATAAFLLGRAAAPAEAARWFRTYLREQPTGLLAREASGRLIESFHRAGRFKSASGAARSYLARYPSGPHAAFARSVLVER